MDITKFISQGSFQPPQEFNSEQNDFKLIPHHINEPKQAQNA